MTDELEIDALGLLCPLPVLRLRKRIAELPKGSRVSLLADDPVAVIDVPHFCNEAGHRFLGADDLVSNGNTDRAPRRYRIITG